MSYLDQIKGLKFKISKVTVDGVDFYLRELHRPISEVLEYPTTEFNYWAVVFQEAEVLEYPTTEFNYWAVVFQEEYYEAHPKERYKAEMTESDCTREVEKFKRMMNPK